MDATAWKLADCPRNERIECGASGTLYVSASVATLRSDGDRAELALAVRAGVVGVSLVVCGARAIDGLQAVARVIGERRYLAERIGRLHDIAGEDTACRRKGDLLVRLRRSCGRPLDTY